MNPRLKSKTNWASMVLAAFGVLETKMPMLQPLLGDGYPLVFVGVAVVYGMLREITKKPVAEL